jgi:arginine deiminase
VWIADDSGAATDANVICVAPDEVVADASEGEGLIGRLVDAGVKVHALDLSEFRKGAGGPSCLILPVERW